MAKQGLAKRFINMFRAEGHSLLDSIEDPVKALELQMKDLSDGVNKTESSVAQAMGNLRMMEADRLRDIAEYEDMGRQAQSGMKHAEKAKEAGDEEKAIRLENLVRDLIVRRQELEGTIRANSSSIDAQTAAVDTMKKNLAQLKTNQQEALRKRDSLVARHVAAETQMKVQETMKSVGTFDVNSEMGRLEGIVRKSEAKALGMTELAAESAPSMMQTLAELDREDAVEAKMAELRSNPSAVKFQLTSLGETSEK